MHINGNVVLKKAPEIDISKKIFDVLEKGLLNLLERVQNTILRQQKVISQRKALLLFCCTHVYLFV